MNKIVVIGSGPAGISAAKAILQRGYRVTMLDVGYELDKNETSFKESLSTKNPEKWTEDEKLKISNSIEFSLNGAKTKNEQGASCKRLGPIWARF